MRELKEKLLERIKKIDSSKESLLNFTKFTFPKYEVSNFHKWLGADLDEFVKNDQVNRMMLFAPP